MGKTPKRKLEYMAEYQKRPENVRKRVARNKARREAIREGKASVGDGTDVHHTKALEHGGYSSKTKVVPRKKNRGYSRGPKNKPTKNTSR